MGADLTLKHGDALCPVLDVHGSSFLIKFGGVPVEVSPSQGPLSLRVAPALKLTAHAATLTDVKIEQAYSPGNDPSSAYAKATRDAEFNYTQNQFQLSQANAQEDLVTAQFGNYKSTGLNPAADAAVAQAEKDAQTGVQVALASPGSNIDLSPSAALPGAYDALQIAFTAEAARAIDNPYLVVVAQLRERNAPEGAARVWVFATALDRIDANPRRIELFKSGFPPGFDIRQIQLHLYEGTEEIATNVAAKRVALTRDEAFEYVKMEYVSSHKGATLPAVPAMGRLPSDLPGRLKGGEFKDALFVKVSKDGVGGDVFRDAGCSKRVDDPYVNALVRQLRFKPALASGMPVEGISEVKLDQLVL